MGLLDDIREKARSIAGLLSDSYQTGAQIYFPNKADASARKKAAGLLSDRAGDAYDYLGKRASVIAADPLGELARSVDNMMGGEYNRQLNQRATLGLDAVAGSDQTNASLQSELNRKLLDVALNGITVWHGSPHKFDKFDMSKIGTGEGAQAYGHGLYMAESPEVARSYLKSNGQGNDLTVTVGGRDVAFGSNITDQQLKAITLLEQGKKDAGQFPHNTAYYAKKRTDDPEIQKIIDEWKDAKIGFKDQSAMYKVDIPDEAVARMLDWDKPLSQQAPEVQKAMAKVIEKKNPRLAQYLQESVGLDEAGKTAARKRLGINIFDTIDTGGATYQAAGQGNIEGMLKNMGIPGIRYLDAGSRAGGQGTSNYVLFSDQLPRILEVNGKPTGQIPWSPGEWKGLLGQ